MILKSCEKLEKSEAKLTIQVEAAEFEAAVEKAYLKERKKIRLPGFRPGKAPRKMIENAYGEGVFYEDAVESSWAPAFMQAVEQENLHFVGDPKIDLEDKITKDGYTFTAVVALYPEVTLGQYKGLSATRPVVTVTDEDVDKRLQELADRNSRLVSVDREAKDGDTAVIDFEGFKDGVPFDGGKGENYSLVLGSHSFVPGFEEQVVGMSANEEKDINVTFPENYHSEELAGKEVTFKVKVHEVKQTVLPEKDDEFVKDVSEFDTMDELRADIEKRILDEKQSGIDRAFENAAVEKAAENMTAEIPESMVDEEVDRQLERMDYELRAQGASLEAYSKMLGGNMDGFRKSLRPNALTAVRTNVMLDAVVDAEKIEVSEEECEEEYKKLADSYKMELDKVKEAVDHDALKADLAGKKAAKLIVDNAVAVEEKKPAKKTAKKSAKKTEDGEKEEAPAETEESVKE